MVAGRRNEPTERRDMFWLFFVAGHFVTGLVCILLACLLTWQRPDGNDIRHALTYGYLNILHAPIIIYLYWAGQLGDAPDNQADDGTAKLLPDGDSHVDAETETPDGSGAGVSFRAE